jgi:hypothetical protein
VSLRRSIVTSAAITATAALAFTPTAGAVDYPPPSKPGTSTGKPSGPFRTLKVCKGKKSCFPRIQDAVNEARPGDTIKVAHGTYREGVIVANAGKRYIKIIGDPKAPSKVVLEAKGMKKKAANGIYIHDAAHVTVNGLTARHFNANGFFALRADNYTFTNLRAYLVGVYGVYAFHTVGGTISDSEAAWNSDSGFYIGETPPQAKPVRSIVKNITSYGNVLGWSGTNMRYVTITDSKFYNNGAGIVPNALDSEKYPPAENNVITRNEVFWNNFDYYQGAPWKARKTAVGNVPFPIGVGVLLFGGRGNEVTENKVYGNWLVGIGALQALTLQNAAAKDLVGNQIMNNDFGLNGTDLNGRDLFYDGNGTDNCVGPNTNVSSTFPEDGSTMPPCPFTGANAFSSDAQSAAVNWTVGDSTHEANYVRHDHAPKPGFTPLEHYVAGTVK